MMSLYYHKEDHGGLVTVDNGYAVAAVDILFEVRTTKIRPHDITNVW